MLFASGHARQCLPFHNYVTTLVICVADILIMYV